MAYHTPLDLGSALDVLGEQPHKIVAGGTDIYPAMKQGRRPAAFLDLTRIAGLDRITHDGEGTRIGAAATWSDVLRAPLPPAFDALRQAAREVGSLQIQNAATLAGNICNASPAADGVPPLLALRAQVELASAARGTRRMALEDFIRGVRQTALAPDEMVTALCVPPQNANAGSAFCKLGSRKYLVISIAMTAANVCVDPYGRIASACVAVGACSAVARRLPLLEQALIGQAPARIEVRPEHLAELSPIDDVRGSGAYRMDVVREQCRRTILRAAGL